MPVILPNVICDEPETNVGLSVIPLNDICPEPETTEIPLKNVPECIVVPAKTCEEPDTKPDGIELILKKVICEEPETNVGLSVIPLNEI